MWLFREAFRPYSYRVTAAHPPHRHRLQAAFAKVRADKLREVTDGHDGTWVAHPGLIPLAKQVRRCRLICLYHMLVCLHIRKCSPVWWLESGGLRALPPPRRLPCTSDLALPPASVCACLPDPDTAGV